MERVFWVGPRSAPSQLADLLGRDHAELLWFDSAERAISAMGSGEAAVAIVTADWPEASNVVVQLKARSSDLQVLLASDAGVPRAVVLSLWAGAAGVLEFRAQSQSEIVLEIQEQITRHRQQRRERELLLRLHGLNEEFLKTIVAAQKRNLDLEQQLHASKGAIAPEDGPAQVMVVDDEPIVHEVLTALLTRKGHSVVSVMDGEGAVKLLWERGFHLVITDKNLPGMSGMEVMKQVKELSPETDVMMMTGYSSTGAAIEALDIGAVAYIEKPFDDVRVVSSRIEKVIQAQRERTKQKRYLHLIKDRNKDFLDRYRALRADLEAWLQAHGGR